MAPRKRPDAATLRKLFEQEGLTYVQVAHKYGVHKRTAQEWAAMAGVQYAPREEPDPDDAVEAAPEESRLVKLLRKRPHTVDDLADALDRGPSSVRRALDALREQGYRINETPYGAYEIGQAVVTDETPVVHAGQDDTVQLAIIADTHLCSVEQQLTALREFYRRAADAGCQRVYHAGDVIAGEGIYQGQQYEIHRAGHDAQVEYAAEVYPDDLPTTFITGNHDLAFLKSAGIDPGQHIAARRPDMEYIGQWNRRVEVAPGIYLDLTHGAGGVAYAASYKLQRALDAYPPGDEPHIVADGHYHIMLQMLRRGMWAYHPGCFEGRTSLLRRLKLHPVVGGWLLTVHVEEPGQVGAIESRFVRFEEREHDF